MYAHVRHAVATCCTLPLLHIVKAACWQPKDSFQFSMHSEGHRPY